MMPQVCIVITPTASQPRFHKRVAQLAQIFDRVEVFSFHRGLYQQNTFIERENTFFHSLGEIQDGQYLKRIKKIVQAISPVKAKAKEYPGAKFYSFGLDCLFIARRAGLKGGCYEIGDLPPITPLHRLIRRYEKSQAKYLDGLVLTSPGFADFFLDFMPKEKIFILENKVPPALAELRPSHKSPPQGNIKIGVIGLLRFEKPLQMLVNFMEQAGQGFELHCYGTGPLQTLFEGSSHPDIHFYGSFKSPEDLPRIYEKVDVSFVVYDNEDYNVIPALPNKLYESAFFGVPLLAAEGTQLGQWAMDWGIGKEIPLEDQESFNHSMQEINPEWINEKSSKGLAKEGEELLDRGEKNLNALFGQYPKG